MAIMTRATDKSDSIEAKQKANRENTIKLAIKAIEGKSLVWTEGAQQMYRDWRRKRSIVLIDCRFGKTRFQSICDGRADERERIKAKEHESV
jgi:hypothetical protein